MKRTCWAWNALVIAGLLGAALLIAVGCPGASNAPSGRRPDASSGAAAPPRSSDARPTSSPPAVVRSASSSADPAAVADGGPTPNDVSAAADRAAPSQPAPATPASHHADASHKAALAAPQDNLFADWPEPKFALFITGRQSGYIEPCGCTGLANQKGGLARRHTLYEQLKAKGWELLALDAGNQVRRYGRQPEIKFQVSAEALQEMDYQAVALGPDDLRLGEGIFGILADSGDRQSPFLCANANLFGLTKTHRVVQAGGERIGVVAVLGEEQLQKLQGADVEKTSPAEGLQKVAPQLENAGCDLQVLIVHGGYEEAKALARRFPQFQVVIAAAGAGEPPSSPEEIGQAQLVLVGEKSMHVGVLGVFNDPQERFRYQLVPLDARWSDSPLMLKLLATYQDTLQNEGLEGLGLIPVPHPSGKEFVGSATCGQCHTQAFAVWETTPHHHATDALVYPGERIEIPRHFDPECLSCHVTGWDPQGYFPYKSGYVDLKESAHLHGNGCENCHGPGSRHVAAELGELDLDEAAIQKLRDEMRLPLAQARERCLDCHDLDNDPHFAAHEEAFAEYWERIKHYGKD